MINAGQGNNFVKSRHIFSISYTRVVSGDGDQPAEAYSRVGLAYVTNTRDSVCTSFDGVLR